MLDGGNREPERAVSPPPATQRPERRRRRWVLPTVAVGILLAAGLIAAVVVSGDGSTGAPPGVAFGRGDIEPTDDGGGSAGGGQLGRHLLIAGAAPVWKPSYAGDNLDAGYLTPTTFALFAAPGATSEDGPWLAVEFDPTSQSGSGPSDTTAATMVGGGVAGGEGGGGAPSEPVVVNGMQGMRSTTFNGSDQLQFEAPDGFGVSIVSRGVSDEQVLAFARAIAFRGDRAGIDAPVLTDELPLVYTAEGIGNLAVAGRGFDFSSGFAPIEVNYVRGEESATLTVADVNGADPLAAAMVLLEEPVATTVHDLPAVRGTDPNGNAVVSWVEDNRVVSLMGPLTDDELAAMAESVREATPDEWDDLIEVSQFGGVDGRTSAMAMLVGAGDLENRENWNVTAGIPSDGDGDGGGGDDDGLDLCLEAVWSVLCERHPADGVDGVPVLIATPSVAEVVGVFAMVPAGQDDAVLRITIGSADPFEIALAAVPNLPGPTAGWATEQRTRFTADLVLSDGTVAATLTDADADAGTEQEPGS